MSLYTKDKPQTIASLFDHIAPHYDKGNAWLSCNLFRLWNRALVQKLSRKNPTTFVDLCGGTGAITEALMKKTPLKKALIVDFSKGMLDVAEKRLKGFPIQCITADIENLPLEENICDCAAVAYGIRNVNDRVAALKEAKRILIPGGTFAILELSTPKNFILKHMHALYLNKLVPWIGKRVAKDKKAYEYLSQSIQGFICAKQLEKEVLDAGFICVETKPLLFGSAVLITATKPL